MKEYWKYVGRSTHGGVDFYMWRCDARKKTSDYLAMIRVSKLIGK